MKTEREVWFTELLVEPGFEQRTRSIAGLLRWLRDEQDRAVPLIF